MTPKDVIPLSHNFYVTSVNKILTLVNNKDHK